MKKDVVSLWTEYTDWLKEAAPQEFKTLQEAATSKDFATFKKATGYDFPESLKTVYKINNGSLRKFKGIKFRMQSFALGGVSFLNIDTILKEWATWKEIVDELGEGEFIPELTGVSHPKKAIKNHHMNLKWLPFSDDASGNYIGVDLDPDTKGTFGQVISFGTDYSERFVLADSFEEFLEQILALIKQDKVEFREEEDGEYIEWVVDGGALETTIIKKRYGKRKIPTPQIDTRVRPRFAVAVAIILAALIAIAIYNAAQPAQVTNDKKCQDAISSMKPDAIEYPESYKYCLLPPNDTAE